MTWRSSATGRPSSSTRSSNVVGSASGATGWFWTKRERATDLADLRGIGGTPVRVVESSTGRVLGTVDPGSSHTTVHAGAVYVHQGESYVVRTLDLDDSVALVDAAEPDYTTSARELTEISDPGHRARSSSIGAANLCFGTVEVTRHVVSFLRRRIATGEVLGRRPARPATTNSAHASRVVDDPDARQRRRSASSQPTSPAPFTRPSTPASGCFRSLRPATDGTSVAYRLRLHPDTGVPTVFVYDGAAGGAGFRRARLHLRKRVAGGNTSDDRRLRVPGGLSLVRPVAQVRERKRPARQGGCPPASRTRGSLTLTVRVWSQPWTSR